MSTTPVKEKLIQLFKQCSDSSEFAKEKKLKCFTKLNDLYLQGLLKSHEELLNKRLEETYEL